MSCTCGRTYECSVLAITTGVLKFVIPSTNPKRLECQGVPNFGGSKRFAFPSFSFFQKSKTMTSSSQVKVPTNLTSYHISSSFIDDSFVQKCQRHQSRSFLYNSQPPSVGQRVEVLMFLKMKREDGTYAELGEGETWEMRSMEEKIRPFRLSGEVVEVRDRPSLER